MGFQPNLIKVFANYEILTTGVDYTVLVDASLGEVEITLPISSDEIKGRFFQIKKVDNTVNVVRIVPNPADTIDYAVNYEINTLNESVTITNNGDSNWYVF